MADDTLLAILRCPEDHSQLRPANAELLARVNLAVEAGRLNNRAGKRVEQRMDGGLVRVGNDVLYPIVDQIPVMLPDEAIPLWQLE